MECPKCNTYNLPSTGKCIQCGSPLKMNSNERLPISDRYYPPRLKNRSKRYRQNFSNKSHATYILIKEIFFDNKSYGYRYISILFSILIPGAGLHRCNKKRQGMVILAVCIFFLLAGVVSYRKSVSNLYFLLSLFIWYAGIFYTVWLIRYHQKIQLRNFKNLLGTALLSFGLVTMLISILSLTPIINYQFPRMEYNIFSPLFLRHDRLLVSELNHIDKDPLNTGDWVIVDVQQDAQSISVIVGTPKDIVVFENGILSINEQQIDPNFVPYIQKDFNIIVPDSSYLLWRVLNVAYHPHNIPFANLVFNTVTRGADEVIQYNADPALLNFKDIKCKILATIFPSDRRRRW